MYDRHGLSPRTCQRYKNSVSHGSIVHDSHRPLFLDSTSSVAIVQTIKDARTNMHALTVSQFTSLTQQQALFTANRHHRPPPSKHLSRWTISRFKHANNISFGLGQSKTHARLLAEADPRNALSEALVLSAFQDQISPHLIINTDSTQVRNS